MKLKRKSFTTAYLTWFYVVFLLVYFLYFYKQVYFLLFYTVHEFKMPGAKICQELCEREVTKKWEIVGYLHLE